jgi:glycosyltransferase involved in cell wall biosynthesis
MTMSNDKTAGRANILIVGPMPPPVHGYSVVTAFIAEKLAALARVETANIAPDSLVRNRRYHAQRLWRAGRALWHIIGARLRCRRLYFAIAGGAGVVYDLPLALTARLLGYRIYIHHHSFSYINRRNRWTAVLIAITGRAATHICLSAGMARRLGSLYPQASRTIVLSNAALIPPGPPRAARNGPIRLGFLSNLIPEKGVDTAIEVAGALRAAKRDIVLAVAGPALDPDMQSLLARTQHALGTGFEYRGPLYGAEKAAFLQDLDVFLFPTRYVNEAQPLVILEALAAGIPVLATSRGTIAEDVGGTAAAISDADYVPESIRIITAWCEDRIRLAELSAATTARAVVAHATAMSELAAFLQEMVEV